MTIAKQDCKCCHCKATIKAGEQMSWYKHTTQSNGHLSKGAVQWKPTCNDSKACGGRMGNAYLAKEAEKAQKDAQEMIDSMRAGVMHGVAMEFPASAIEGMIALYASKGIVVV